ncbi:hypothetical protein, partial [Bradyrhizobium liaoningense]|uniref:hypothetical protein n=1 Tax=Bradyrhizobium liaoningense TaxID=43992 RepID=UPI001BAA9639
APEPCPRRTGSDQKEEAPRPWADAYDRGDAKEPESSRLEEARRIVEEYANDLRKIIQKLRRKMN